MMAVSARQASGSPTYGYGHGYGQPRYVGPLASSVPAGIGGKIIPVSDTYEVAAARDKFFRAYQDQLNTIYAIRASRPQRYGTPGYGTASAGPVHVSHSTHGAPVHASHSTHGAPVHVSHSTHGAPVHVSHPAHASAVQVSHSAHKPAVHVSHSVHKPAVHVSQPVHKPAVHVSHSTHGAPAVSVSHSVHAPAVTHAGYNPSVHVSHSTHGVHPGGYSGVPVQVQDTPEVAAAKAQFFAEYNKRAALAAAAPDDKPYYY